MPYKLRHLSQECKCILGAWELRGSCTTKAMLGSSQLLYDSVDRHGSVLHDEYFGLSRSRLYDRMQVTRCFHKCTFSHDIYAMRCSRSTVTTVTVHSRGLLDRRIGQPRKQRRRRRATRHLPRGCSAAGWRFWPMRLRVRNPRLFSSKLT